MRVAVRPASAADHEGILELYRQVDEMHLDFASHTFRRSEEPLRTREWIAGLLADPESLLLVAEDDSSLVGLLEVVVRDTPDLPFLVPTRFVTVNTLVVDERSRRHGVGRALMAGAREWARAQGAQEFRLTVYEANRGALEFYRSLGFEPVKRDLRLPLGD